MIRFATIVLSAALSPLGCGAPRPDIPAATTEMARHQLFFAAGGPAPTLLAVVFQRTRDERGGALEAKAFLAWDGAWRTPFYERVEVRAWPGDALEPAVEAWRAARPDRALRLDWRDAQDGLHVALRSPSAGVRVDAPRLAQAGEGRDPHGRVRWRAGPGTLEVNGAIREGLVVVEELLPPAVARPGFGRFVMWLGAPGPGALVLGRRTLSSGDPGEALRVGASGSAIAPALDLAVRATRAEAHTGWALPTAWRVDGEDLTRTDGALGRGEGPRGPALYDIALARGATGAGLVFHLQDAPE